MGPEPSPDAGLVLAMPLQPLLELRGFASSAAIEPLESLAGESWISTTEAVAADPLARIVHLGVVAVRAGGEVLVADDGRLLHHAAVPAEALGDPLLATLRRLALAAGAHLLARPEAEGLRAELAGWLHEPTLPGLERAVVLVYRLHLPAGLPTPGGHAWISRPRLADLALDPVSALATEALG